MIIYLKISMTQLCNLRINTFLLSKNAFCGTIFFSRIEDYVVGLFPSATEMEYFGSRITYKIATEEVKNLSAVFSHLEAGE